MKKSLLNYYNNSFLTDSLQSETIHSICNNPQIPQNSTTTKISKPRLSLLTRVSHLFLCAFTGKMACSRYWVNLPIVTWREVKSFSVRDRPQEEAAGRHLH
ncbi:hypothetical protein CDAR_91161 [Caerostris darwini]|uniref:Uncharacterized protein n=1 Tax=Caerostris darwini TaxID=1538125 RepID=A0AAV4PU31_9ARAC|nr:hypothetical protein CDAR_91161 [Caerostris darwini]